MGELVLGHRFQTGVPTTRRVNRRVVVHAERDSLSDVASSCLTDGGREFGDHVRHRNDVEDALAPAKQVHQVTIVARQHGAGVAQDQTARGEIGAE